MFAWLRYEIKNHYQSFRFASLHFDTIAITAPQYSISRGASSVSERVFTTEACAAPGGVYTQGPDLHLDVSVLQRLGCSWRCLHHMGRAASEHVSLQRPVLHLNVSALQRYVLLLEVSTPQGPELHVDVASPRGPVPTYCWVCSVRFKNNLLTVGRVCFASKIIFLLSNVFALLRK